MAAAAAGKMKRKDMEDVYNEFSDFSLSAPPTKIRRLDHAELLPPIVEEEEPPAAVFNQMTMTTPPAAAAVPIEDMSMNGVEESMVPLLPDEERALVLYKPPVNNNNHNILSNLPYIVSSDIISGIKNQCFWRGNLARTEEEEAPVNDDEQVANNCLALIPWQTTPVNAYAGLDMVSGYGPSEDMMDAAEGCASMEIEENIIGEATSSGIGGGDGGFHQRPQHCMIPQQLPPNPSTPIMWSWG